MSKPKIQVFAVVRLDKYLLADGDLENHIVVQAVLPSFEEAQREEARLSAMRDPSKILYFVRATRYYPEGRPSSQESSQES